MKLIFGPQAIASTWSRNVNQLASSGPLNLERARERTGPSWTRTRPLGTPKLRDWLYSADGCFGGGDDVYC